VGGDRGGLDQDEVEKVWRIGKGGRGPSGVTPYKRDRVESYLWVGYAAYLVWMAVRRRLREAPIRLSPEKEMFQLRRGEMVKFRVGEKEKGDGPKAVGEGA
jgi:hypothetical protein